MVHTKAWSHSHQGHGQTSGDGCWAIPSPSPQLAHATVEDTRCTDLKCIDSGAGEDWLFPKGHYDIASWLFQKLNLWPSGYRTVSGNARPTRLLLGNESVQKHQTDIAVYMTNCCF